MIVSILADNSLLTWILGKDTTEQGVPHLQWVNLPESWGVFVLIGVVLAMGFAVAWLYLREIDTCPRSVKWLLAVLRFSVLFMLVLIYLKPSISFKQTHSLKPNVALLRDASLSFARGDKYADLQQIERLMAATGWSEQQLRDGTFSRAEILQQAMQNDQGRLTEKLRQHGTVRVVDFSEVVNHVGMLPAAQEQAGTADGGASQADGSTSPSVFLQSLPPLQPTGRGTDIWQALREMLGDANRLSAILLASDGQHNGSEDPLEMARKAADLGIPVFALGLGDPSRPKNVAVTDLYVRAKARPNEPFEVEALLYAEDLDTDQVEVQLIEHPIDPRSGTPGPERPLQSQSLTVPPQGGRLRADFQHTVVEPGKYVYTVKVDALEGESEVADNSMSSGELEVIDEKVKVLLIAGAPTWEYQMVHRLLQRDQAISVSCWLQTMDPDRPQEGNEPISQLPRTIEELGKYNVIMMFDPNPDEFDEKWIDALKQFCRRKAGGFLYVAGQKHTNMFVTLNRLSGIRDLLPVRFGDEEFIETSQTLATTVNSRPGKMLVAKHHLDHPVMSFHSDQLENEKRWAQMPEIYWSFPTLSAKPTAQVLMERGDQVNEEGNQPLIVAGRFGAGNVLYFGFNGTWRWRSVGLQAQYFDRFWIQVVRFLVETRSLQGSRRGIIDPDRAEYELGDKVTLVARVVDERFEPLALPNIEAVVRSEDGRSRQVDLKLLPGQQGEYEASFVAQKTGQFQVFVNLPGADGQSAIEPVSFRVRPPSVEANAYWLNEKLLREIAEISGGRYITVDQLDQVIDELPGLVTTTQYSSPPEPIWDVNKSLRFLAFLLPFLLLTAEWAVRKRFKLL